MERKRAFIYIGGEVCAERISDRPDENAIVIAADAGYFNARACGVSPKLAVGDFDSMDESGLPADVERIRVPAEKNETDTQLALSLALDMGAQEVVIIGGMSGRLDHTLSNLALLEQLWSRGIPAILTDGNNRARFIRNSGTLLPRSHFRYFALLPADPIVKGVSVDGAKYPLKNAKLSRTNPYAVSNEIVGNCALIDVRRGGIWVVESV